MQLATEIRWQDSRFMVPIERIQASERWGYDAVFTAEAFGSDAFTPLGYVAALTERLTLGTCIAQVTGRSPGVTAMSYQTLHAMSGGRVMAGLGSSSGPLSAAVHGRPWGSPLERMRDFVTLLIRQGLLTLRRVGKQIYQGLSLFVFGRFTCRILRFLLRSIGSSFLLRVFGDFLLRLVSFSFLLGVLGGFLLRVFDDLLLGLFSSLFLGFFLMVIEKVER